MRMIPWTLALALACGAASGAGPGPGPGVRRGGGWGAGGDYARRFDPKTVVTLKGRVEAVEKVSPMRGMGPGVHLRLKTEKETLPVHLGPAWYLDNQELELAKGDEVEVRGSRVEFDGKPALVAVEVERDGMVLRLRDEDGFPLWSGWRRR